MLDGVGGTRRIAEEDSLVVFWIQFSTLRQRSEYPSLGADEFSVPALEPNIRGNLAKGDG
jgi:hypothetical protein